MQILPQKAGIYGMLGGQVVDVEFEGLPLEREKLDFIYDLKTGALIESSMLIGAVLAGADEEVQNVILQVAMEILVWHFRFRTIFWMLPVILRRLENRSEAMKRIIRQPM